MNKTQSPTLADSICDLRASKIKSTFFTQMNKLADWCLIETIIEEHYSKGKRATGKPAYEGLLLFEGVPTSDLIWIKPTMM